MLLLNILCQKKKTKSNRHIYLLNVSFFLFFLNIHNDVKLSPCDLRIAVLRGLGIKIGAVMLENKWIHIIIILNSNNFVPLIA